ncbi:MAG: hypothetical protein R3B90_11880 [Planctomycetaceae bacterium]
MSSRDGDNAGDHPGGRDFDATAGGQPMVVLSGRASGLTNYSLRTLLTREQLELLEMPGDPLVP